MALHYLAEEAFAELLGNWRHHDDLQSRRSASVGQLARSARAVDHARARMRRLRAALYPTDDEARVALTTALCPILDEVVLLGPGHRSFSRPAMLRCPCGELVSLEGRI